MVQQITLDRPVLPTQTALRLEQAKTMQANRALAERQQDIKEQELTLKQQTIGSQLEQTNYLNDLRSRAATDPQALRELAVYKPQEVSDFLDYRNQTTQRLGKAALAVKTAPLPNRAEAYQRQLKILEAEGYPTENLPAEYDPKVVDPQLDEIVTMSRDVEKTLESLEPKEPRKREIRATEEGLFAIDPVTLEAEPLEGRMGQRLMPQKAPQTVVKLGEAESEEQKQIGRIRAARFQKYMDSGDAAQRGLDTLRTLEQAVSNPDVAQGAFAGLRQESKKVAELFGADVKGLEDEAIVAAIGNKLALQLRNPKGEDGGLTGATSDRDLKFLVAGVPNRDKTREQNLALIELAKRDKDRTVRLKNEAANYLEQNNTMAGFEQYKKQWLEQNPLFEEGSQEKENIKRLLRAGPLEGKAKSQTRIKFLGFE